MIRESITSPGTPGIVVGLDRPDSWTVEHGASTPAFLALQPAEGAGPFRDNLVVALEELPAEGPRDLEAVQTTARAQALATVPDYQLIDDRPMEVGGIDGWFRAAVYSAESMTTVVVRQLFALQGDVLVTIALTTFPFRDAEASQLFEDLSATCAITAEKGGA